MIDSSANCACHRARPSVVLSLVSPHRFWSFIAVTCIPAGSLFTESLDDDFSAVFFPLAKTSISSVPSHSHCAETVESSPPLRSNQCGQSLQILNSRELLAGNLIVNRARRAPHIRRNGKLNYQERGSKSPPREKQLGCEPHRSSDEPTSRITLAFSRNLSWQTRPTMLAPTFLGFFTVLENC